MDGKAAFRAPRLKISAAGRGETLARSRVQARSHEMVIDEPTDRHGTDLGASPLEVLAGALIGCTNVIASRIATEMGIELHDVEVQTVLELDGRVLAGEIVEIVFPRVRLSVSAGSTATPDQIDALRHQLARRCPIALLLRQAGAEMVDEWKIRPANPLPGPTAQA